MAAPSNTAPAGARRRLLMQIFEGLTIGLPFCAFKIIAGLHFMPRAAALGWALLLLGVLDLAVNLLNLGSLIVRGRRALDACMLALLTRRLKAKTNRAWAWRNLGMALDVLLAMSLVAYMIGTGAFARFPRACLAIWNLSVILNVLGAGILRLGQSWHDLEAPAAEDRRAIG